MLDDLGKALKHSIRILSLQALSSIIKYYQALLSYQFVTEFLPNFIKNE